MAIFRSEFLKSCNGCHAVVLYCLDSDTPWQSILSSILIIRPRCYHIWLRMHHIKYALYNIMHTGTRPLLAGTSLYSHSLGHKYIRHFCTIQSLPNSLLYGQDSAEKVRRPQAEAPFQHCPDRIIVKLVGIVFLY